MKTEKEIRLHINSLTQKTSKIWNLPDNELVEIPNWEGWVLGYTAMIGALKWVLEEDDQLHASDILETH